MSYSFFWLFEKYCLKPLGMIVFAIVAIIVVLYIIWKNRKAPKWDFVLVYIAVVAASVFVIVTQCIELFHGRFVLITEKPGDAIQVEGVLTKVLEILPNGKEYTHIEEYTYTDYKKAYELAVIVNGEKYYWTEYCEGFEIGDLVELKVLRRSRLILRIKKIRDDLYSSDDLGLNIIDKTQNALRLLVLKEHSLWKEYSADKHRVSSSNWNGTNEIAMCRHPKASQLVISRN